MANIPLLAEEGWRDSLIEAGAPGWSVRRNLSAGLTTPSAPSLRSAHPPLLCEEGNVRIVQLVVPHHRYELLDSLVLLNLAGVDVALGIHRDGIDPVELAGIGAV